MARCKVLYDYELTEERPFVLAKLTRDRRTSQTQYVVLDRFKTFRQASDALAEFGTAAA